jgi:imidazole glycerol-phosphate synthase subunit HisH
VRIDAAAGGGTPLKVPHMGWNTLGFPAGAGAAGHALLDGIEAGAYVYFVHSYHFEPAEPAATLATTDYGATLVAAVVRGNLAGTQFHPEKSQAVGLRLIANFLDWRP